MEHETDQNEKQIRKKKKKLGALLELSSLLKPIQAQVEASLSHSSLSTFTHSNVVL